MTFHEDAVRRTALNVAADIFGVQPAVFVQLAAKRRNISLE